MSENIKNSDEKIIALKENEEKNPIKKREIIKTLIIIFLAAMLLLTFFSNTIMNRSLPEITTETTSSGKLTERVRGSGMIMSNQTYEVTIDSVRVIEKINIKSGQKIKKDDVLFTVTVGSSTELREAETALDSMMLQYQTALLSEPVDYSSENQAIKNAREDLNQAIARRDQAYNNQTNLEQEKNQYLNDKQELSTLSAKQGKLSAAITAIDSDDYSAAPPEYTGNLPVLYGAYADADAEYNTAYGLYSKAVEEGTDEAIVNSAKADADAKMIVRDEAKRIYDEEKILIRSDLAVQLADIDYQITDISGRITQYESNSQGGGMSYEDCVADVRMKERALEDLIINLQKAQKADNINSQISSLNLESQKKAIDKQKEKIAELKAKTTATEIKSKYD
ncbi:MAG: efflux RND transporter periplasmic adaptor subunit, partial [Ruminococcus sp.]|nr:efflux RND transporter periplasmic adaptor subunit [Ruminococcus sp.]